MKTARMGSSVRIRYSISLDDGSSVGRDKTSTPLSFKIGSGKVFRKLEEGVVGMQVNETRRLEIKAEEAYGRYNKENVLRVDRKMFPEDVKLIPGRTVQYQNRDGERVNLVVNAVSDTIVTVDANHPLAGLDLIYEVEMVEIL